jgi:hypothetical protein
MPGSRDARKRHGRALLDQDMATHDSPAARTEHAAVQAHGEILSFDEVADLHPGEWVVMELFDQQVGELPSRGRLIAHDPSRERMDEVIRQLPRLPAGSGRAYSLFQALHYIRTGAEMRAALECAREVDGEGAWRRW